MVDQKKRYTVEECLQILDDNVDIPGEGFESDIEDVDDDDFESLEPDMTGSLRNTTGNTFQFQNLDEEEDEGPDRVSKMDIDFNDMHVEVQGNSPSSNHGRPANVSLANKEWEQNDTGIPIPNFSQKEGPTKILPVNSTEHDFFLLLVDNRILNNIVKESNIYAEQSFPIMTLIYHYQLVLCKLNCYNIIFEI